MSQTTAAQRPSLEALGGRNQVSCWENGLERPPSRYRHAFIDYLGDVLGVSTAREQKVALAKTVTKFFSSEKDQYRRNMIYVPHWSAKSRPPLSGQKRPLSQVSRQAAASVRARFLRKKHAACLAHSMFCLRTERILTRNSDGNFVKKVLSAKTCSNGVGTPGTK
jgi:hypothetical protein